MSQTLWIEDAWPGLALLAQGRLTAWLQAVSVNRAWESHCQAPPTPNSPLDLDCRDGRLAGAAGGQMGSNNEARLFVTERPGFRGRRSDSDAGVGQGRKRRASPLNATNLGDGETPLALRTCLRRFFLPRG